MSIIEQAIQIVNETYEAEGIYEYDSTIRNRVQQWYDRTDVADPYILAACAISGDYEPGLTQSELQEKKDFFFPECKEFYDSYALAHDNYNYNIEEIELALHD